MIGDADQRGSLDQEWIETREQQLPPDTRLTPPDVASNAASIASLNRTAVGEPPMDYTVRSVYDSRPINGYDFNVSGSDEAVDTLSSVLIVNFVVPDGYVMVPRELHHWMTPDFGSNREDIQCTIFLNGAAVPNNQNIPCGSASDNLIKLFFVADTGSTVGIQFTSLIGNYPIDTLAWAHLYGNLILKTSRPAIFEIANPAKSLITATSGPVIPNGGTV